MRVRARIRPLRPLSRPLAFRAVPSFQVALRPVVPSRRPTEVELLIGDPAKAATELGWTASTSLDQLCEEMVKSDLDLLEKGDFTS